MADPIREALKRLLAVIKPKYTDPDEIVAVVRAMAAARTAIAAHEAARPTPTPEALQAAYAAWFKAEQGIPPSPAAARTAAAFALHLLRVEVAA